MEVDNEVFNEGKTFVFLETEKTQETTPEAAADYKKDIRRKKEKKYLN